MKKIDVSEWREFTVKELGLSVYHGKRLVVKDRLDGDIPFLTAGKENRGLKGFIGNDVDIYKNPITIDMFGNTFFHKGSFSGDDNVYFFIDYDYEFYSNKENKDKVIENKYSDEVKLFLSCTIQKYIADNFDFKDQFREHYIEKVVVKLPVKPNKEPDWEYMENYIKVLKTRERERVSHLLRLS